MLNTLLNINWVFLKLNTCLKALQNWGEKKNKTYKANPLAALAQKSRKVYLAIKVKSLKKHPYLRGTMEIMAQTPPITYVKSEQ